MLSVGTADTWGEYFDVNGNALESNLVQAARAEELEYIQKVNIWELTSINECFATTGRKPITLRWIDTNKGDIDHPNYRSRLVVREIRRKGQSVEDCMRFSSMPPLEALKTLLSFRQTMKVSK